MSHYKLLINTGLLTAFLLFLLTGAAIWVKIDFEQWKESTGNFAANFKSDYVGSERYKETTETIMSSIKSILKIAEKSPDDFNSLNVDNILNGFKHRDFNDNYYLELAVSKNWKVVTDDSDYFTFNHPSLKIFTFNDKAFTN